MGLTTPVKVFFNNDIDYNDNSNNKDKNNDGNEIAIVTQSVARIVFQPTESSYYKSEMDEKQEEEKDEKKQKTKLQGGVKVVVEQLETGEIRVRARRCDFDEDTMIKEMSEETIIKQLTKAIDVWKQQQVQAKA